MMTVDQARELYRTNGDNAVNACIARLAGQGLDEEERARQLRTAMNAAREQTRRQVNDEAVWAAAMEPRDHGRGRPNTKLARLNTSSIDFDASVPRSTRRQRRSSD